MSTSVNEVTLLGRLGKDPEIRYTSGGAGVANISLATDESYKNKTTGEKVKKTEWHNLVSWISIEFIQQYLHKGDLIFVKGKIQTRKWDKDGETKYITEINVTDIKPVVTARSDAAPATATNNKPAQQAQTGSRSATHRPPQQAQKPQQQQQAPEPEIDDSDIPF